MKTLRNRVHLIGRLGTDPEIFSFEGDKKKSKLNLATNEFYKNSKGEKVEETTWHNVIAWGKTAELTEKFLKKGSEIAVEGRLTNRKYEDKEGKNRVVTEVVMNEFLMLDKKKS